MMKHLTTALAFTALASMSLWANHPVLVEGNCNFAPAGSQPGAVPPGTCGDFDGDGRIGILEDNDGTDRVFGTIAAAIGANGVNNNGTITIVTSGTFPEVVTITGNVTLQAAPGVIANIDAVLQGDAGTTARQSQPGIIVNAPANRYVVIRNIRSNNWTSGIQVNGASRVAIDNCVLENNINYGIEVTGTSRVAITGSLVHATGFRLNPATGDFPTTATPNPGKGIEFDDSSTGSVFNTTVTGSFSAGISNMTGKDKSVRVNHSHLFDNSPNLQGIKKSNDDDDKDR